MRTIARNGERNRKARRRTAAALTEFFFPVHYEIGTALEDAVRADVLSRQQAASLWLIRSQGEGGNQMRRKDIEKNIRRWFEVTNAAVSRALRAMTRPPLELIEIREDPRSGREKLVTLTPNGKQFLDSAAARATRVVAEMIEDISPELAAAAIDYFDHLTRGFQRVQTRNQISRTWPDPRLRRTDNRPVKRDHEAGWDNFNQMAPIPSR